MGNPGWSYAEVLPYFKRNERRIGEGDDRYRGREGPFTITDIDEPDPLCEVFMEGARSLGIPRNPDYNGAVQDGIGYVQRSIHHGRRVSPARAFLYPAVKRGNVDLRTEAHVVKIYSMENVLLACATGGGGATRPFSPGRKSFCVAERSLHRSCCRFQVSVRRSICKRSAFPLSTRCLASVKTCVTITLRAWSRASEV